MDKVFLDANVLFSAAYRSDSGLIRLWTLKGIELITSAYTLEEAETNLLKDEQHIQLKKLIRTVKIIGELPNRPLPEGIDLPEKDQPILITAINAKATHLLTGDFRHFGQYYGRVIDGTLILPPGEYLRMKMAKSTHPNS